MIERYRLAAGDLTELARGYGGARAIAILGSSQLSKRLLLLRYIERAWPGSHAERDHAFAVVACAQARNPAAVMEVLADPFVGRWAAYTARQLRRNPSIDGPVRADLNHFDAIACAIAVRSTVVSEFTISPHQGLISLPTVGCVLVRTPGKPVVLRSRSGGVTIGLRAADPASTGTWLPVRRLEAQGEGPRIGITVDDLNPYRDCFHMPAAGRLPTAEIGTWNRRLTAAWLLISEHAPERAAELAAGLRSVVPLTGHERGPSSATSGDAFGAAAVTRPGSPVELAVALVHEFQHSKLCAVADLLSLYDTTDKRRYFAPWRPDPRPIEALFQGVYAFLGVADLWQRLRAEPLLEHVAEEQFAVIREQVHAGMLCLSGATSLSATGRRLADGMRKALDAMYRTDVARPVLLSARRALRQRRRAWLVRTDGRSP
jgi:HEXXH motif-containing protein